MASATRQQIIGGGDGADQEKSAAVPTYCRRRGRRTALPCYRSLFPALRSALLIYPPLKIDIA